MLFVQWYEDGPNKSLINQQEIYQLCGDVEKIKLKENYKNLTAYVSYKNNQAAATAFVVLSFFLRASIIHRTESKFYLEQFNIANFSLEKQNAAINTVFFFMFATRRIKLQLMIKSKNQHINSIIKWH